jgi:hypothetical protein
MADDDFVTLVCPSGAELAPISHGVVSYEPWHDHTHNLWLVRVPMAAATHFCWNGGFYKAPDALQGERGL